MVSPKILVADTDADFRSEIGKFLMDHNFLMYEAESITEAEDIAMRLKPDLAIIDLLASDDESGFVLSYHLKKKYPEMPVILVSNVASETGISFSLNTNEEKHWLWADIILEKASTNDQLHKEILKLLKM